MLNFIGETEEYNIMVQIYNLSNSAEDLKLQMKLKQNFKDKATKKLKNYLLIFRKTLDTIFNANLKVVFL